MCCGGVILLDLAGRFWYHSSNWGCCEVVKRVSCRVVSSLPLDGGPSRARRCDEEARGECNDSTGRVRFESPVDPATYTLRPGGVSVSAEIPLSGGILDCYA